MDIIANKLVRSMNKQNIEFNVSKHAMASVMLHTQSRLENLALIIEKNHQHIVDLGKATREEATWIRRFNAELTLLLAKDMYLTRKLRDRAQRLMIGITRTLQGIVAPELVPLAILSKTLSHIKEQLTTVYPEFRLLHEDLAPYYSTVKAHLTRKENTIFVSLLIPITLKRNGINYL